MASVLMSLPEACGERDCAVGWHVRHIWTYEDGTYSQCDADGNHDDISADDVPSVAEHKAAWLEYARHVVATGEDPLREYTGVPRTRKRSEAWRVRIVNSIAGPLAARIVRGRRDVSRDSLPEHVVGYLNLDAARRRLQDFAAWPDLEAAGVAMSRRGWHAFKLDVDVPRRADVVARELKLVASEHIRRAKREAARMSALTAA